MVRIGDQVAREVGLQKLSRHTSQTPEHSPCPECGHAGKLVGRKARDVLTRRGPVPVTEAKYRCPKCRRLFFPSDGRSGTGIAVPLHAADVSSDRVCGDAGRQL
jgi:rubredoxin